MSREDLKMEINKQLEMIVRKFNKRSMGHIAHLSNNDNNKKSSFWVIIKYLDNVVK